MRKLPQIHIGTIIGEHLKKEKRSVAWLAEKVGCDANCLRKQFKKPYISTDLLYRTSNILNKDFFAFYSQQLSKEIKNEQILPEK